MRKIKHEKAPNGEWITKLTTGLFTLNVEDNPGQLYNLRDAINRRGMKVIGYGNFPTGLDPDPIRRRKYTMHNDPNSPNPWDMMAHECDNFINNGQNIIAQANAQAESKFAEALAQERAARQAAEAELARSKTGEKSGQGAGAGGANGGEASPAEGAARRGPGRPPQSSARE